MHLLVLPGCSNTDPPAPAERWAQALVSSLNSHRLEQLSGFLGDGFERYEDPLSNGPRSGPSLAYYWIITWGHFPDLRFEIEHAAGDNKLVVIEWRATGLREQSAPPVRGVYVMELESDRVVALRGYFDPRGLVRQRKK